MLPVQFDTATETSLSALEVPIAALMSAASSPAPEKMSTTACGGVSSTVRETTVELKAPPGGRQPVPLAALKGAASPRGAPPPPAGASRSRRACGTSSTASPSLVLQFLEG